MEYELSYAGIPFRQPDAELTDFVDRFMALDDLRDIHPRAAVPGKNLLGLSSPESQFPLSVRLNEFHYPTGASRWSVFRGIASATDVLAMRKLAFLDNVATPQTFVVQAETLSSEGSVSTPMHMLPPRPIALPVEGVLPGVYLVTLVDERFYWQFRGAGQILCTGSTGTWSGLVSHIATQLGVTITVSSPDSTYGTPEPDSALYSNYENPALLLDAVAANIGCVVVRNLDGTYKLVRHSAATAAALSSRPDNTERVAGGLMWETEVGTYDPRAAVINSSVVVTFPKWVDNIGYYKPGVYKGNGTTSYDDVLAITVTPADAGTPYSELPTIAVPKVFRDTAKARYPSTPPVTADNLTALTSLARLIAKDWWDSQSCAIDEVYPGVRPWTPDGATDVLWRFCGDGLTRVWRRPFGWGPGELQHGIGGAVEAVDCCPAWVRATTINPDDLSLFGGIEESYNPATGVWSVVRSVWLMDPNDVTPNFVSGVRYLSRRLGNKSLRPLFSTSCCPGEPGSGSGGGAGGLCPIPVDEIGNSFAPMFGYLTTSGTPCGCNGDVGGYFYLTYDAGASDYANDFIVYTGTIQCLDADDELCDLSMVYVCDHGLQHIEITYGVTTYTVNAGTSDAFSVTFSYPTTGCGDCDTVTIVYADPIETDCCPDDAIPRLLNATITGKTGALVNLGGGSGTRTVGLAAPNAAPSPTVNGWLYEGNNEEISLVCSGSDWSASVVRGSCTYETSGGTITITSVSCDPFEIVLSINVTGMGSCNGTATITITE